MFGRKVDSTVRWHSQDTFSTKHFNFNCSISRYDAATDDTSVAILKNRSMLALYDTILPKHLGNVFEIGFFHAGMPLYLADTRPVQKIVAFDYKQVSDSITRHIKQARLTDSVRLFGGIMQDQTQEISKLLDREFRGQPLDLIIDDCSHKYELTKSSFEAYFTRLKPGGKYIIEDWGWAHWNSEPWQSEASPFHGEPALTNVLFEILMAMASAPEEIAKVEVPNSAMIVVTRGTGRAWPTPFKLSDVTLTAGRQFVRL